MAEVSIEAGQLRIAIQGMRKVWTLKSEITVPLANVSGASVDRDLRERFPGLLDKRVGTDLFGIYHGGTFVQDGDRVFWDVRHPEKAIVIGLDNEDFSRLIIEVESPEDVVAQIEQAVASMRKP